MVEKRVKNLKQVIDHYRKALAKEIRVQQVILFGSYARGKPRDYSDIDLAIVSPDFRKGIKDELFLDRIACQITPLIEAFPYTPSDLKRKRKGTFLDEIVRTGKVVYHS